MTFSRPVRSFLIGIGTTGRRALPANPQAELLCSIRHLRDVKIKAGAGEQ